MSPRSALIERNRQAIRDIAARHHGLSVSVFGSVARGEGHVDSDIDFLVDFDAEASLLDLIRITQELSDLLGCSVDVLSLAGLKPSDEQIRRDAIPV